MASDHPARARRGAEAVPHGGTASALHKATAGTLRITNVAPYTIRLNAIVLRQRQAAAAA
ncbi:hypothetical protein OG393_31530 [Streptomyces sp. NBC_01216]|uniref:hypothetical protein n=1 Tax=Streptomyces sp. NBC_01216 TaxID=2903778 RepID=UPI002E0E0768|nr:hypothetical protein OG393_31530 [Streptomyces sp. NBC_01216]